MRKYKCIIFDYDGVLVDSLLGVRAAKTGGFDVFGFTAHDYNNELRADATHTFSSMNLLLSIIKS